MYKAIVFDFSRVLIFPKDKSYKGSMNDLYRAHVKDKNFRLLDWYVLNEELLEKLAEIKDNYELFVFTSGASLHLDPEVLPRLGQVFTNILNAADVGADKDTSTAYHLLADTIGFEPSEMLFIDDTMENIAAAKEAGLVTHQYKHNKDLFKILN